MQHRVRLPAFWPDHVERWFSACEAQFAAYGIHNQHARYSCILALLRPEDTSYLSDLILNPDPKRPYDRLKTGLITRSKTAHWRCARGETPSVILKKIRQALYQKAMDTDEAALKEMIVPFLPPMVREIIEPVREIASVDQLVQMADRVLALKTEGEAMEAAFGEMVFCQQRQQHQQQVPHIEQPWRQRSGRFRRRSASANGRRPRPRAQSQATRYYHQEFEEPVWNCRTIQS